ncbi:DMT family transporter [Paracoccus sp. MBLB3053]|uniref:DMT family transporter n=1 Tax=Paracoccus aurantius TaxID=3073814 RepID=A0ABU2HY53_9RHOB|nr:DMT family transporter [Paracoccus sp. MBLB3053]MDS9469988.1 DMT family transporter [Paracoccus sp. MBLB3053]
MTERGRVLWADLAVLGVAVVWGASYPIAKGALAHAPVLVLIFYRFVVTALAMSAIARREILAAAPRDLAAGAVLGAILCAIFLAETWGVAMTSATNAALIISLCTLLTPLIEFGLRRRLPPAGILLGAGIAIAGVGLVAGGLDRLGMGDFLILVAAGLRAVMVVATKRLMADRAIGSAALTAVQAGTVGTLTLALVLTGYSGESGGGELIVGAGLPFWAAVGFLSLFCTIAAFYVQNAAIRHTSPTRVSFLMGTEPLFGVLLARALLAETASPATIAGTGLILGGTFLGLLAERQVPRGPAQTTLSRGSQPPAHRAEAP